MASSSKSKKAESEKADRLSALPRRLLLHILSFLPTKYAVQTCILSRRWEDLWTSIPALDFDDHDLFSSEYMDSEGSTSSLSKDLFHFVNRVLILRDGSNLRKFRLHLKGINRAPCVDRWLCYAVKHSVQEIDFCFWWNGPYRPPRQLFSCESLKQMKLNLRDGSLELPTCISLPYLELLKMARFNTNPGSSVRQILCRCPKLKILNLKRCSLRTADIFDVSCCSFLERVTLKRCDLASSEIFDVSSCSCLESLSLKCTRLVGVKMVNISAPKLKSLTIKKSMASWDCSLKISAPNLLYLKYEDCLVRELCIENLPFLMDAVVDWKGSLKVHEVYIFTPFPESHSIDEVQSGIEFLISLKHARTLRLYGFFSQFGSRKRDLCMELPISFTNLKFLELGIKYFGINDIHSIACLLKCCPSVENLHFEFEGSPVYLGGSREWDDDPVCLEGSWEWDDFPYGCVLHHLKQVEMRQFRGCNSELSLLKLLLENAKVLERVNLVADCAWHVGVQKRKVISQKLQTCPRASSKMLILFL